MSSAFYASWCEISLARMEKNWLLALAQAPAGTRICAVLKADAYGHGIANVVPVLMRHGVSHIGITSNPEAQAVRAAGFTGVLMRLRSTTREEAEDALPLRIEEQVSTLSSARFLMDLDARRPAPAALHLSLNAGGMSRDGLEISTAQGRAECQGILHLAGHRIAGICTHFPSNEAAELRASIARFHQDADWVLAQGVLRREEILLHGGSSFTLMSGIDPRVDMMRCGAVLYGIAGAGRGFAPTMALKARVTNAAAFPAGSTIGYDRAARLEEDRVLANISLGYSNGYVRQFTGRARVLIRGRLLPVLGKISMNTVVVDVSSLPEVQTGDEAVAFGAQDGAEITVAMIEAQSGTIMADLYTDWGHRNPRVLRD